MKRPKLMYLVLALLFLLPASAMFLLRHPSVKQYEAIAFPEAASGPGLRVTFLGVSTLLFRDETAAVLVDGFFSRPGLLHTAVGRIEPDTERIAAALARAGITRLDAVVAAHSHYDHAMDVAEVAKRTGAIVVGSRSTANIALGGDLAEDRIHVVQGTETLSFGDLRMTLVPSAHYPHGKAMGEIAERLKPPARVMDYLEGGSFSILIERAGKSVLVQASAGYVKGSLAGRHADVVYLGVGLLGKNDEAYREEYWRETAGAVGARRVIPIHWDDFFVGLDEPLRALPRAFDNLDASMKFVTERARRDGIDVRWPVLWRVTDPFAGLG